MNAPSSLPTVWTLGHSNRTWAEFVALLREAGIELVADVRRFPGSRRFPHFAAQAMQPALAAEGIGYRHFPQLGGRRGRPKAGSPNRGWRVAGFNAYADHMATAQFQQGLAELLQVARQRRTALLCAEALPWRCHRQLLADALLVQGAEVVHLLGPGRRQPHRLSPVARVDQGRLTYPGEPLLFDSRE